MYYIGSLGEKFRPLALMYALLAALSAFGIGNLSQISSAAGAVAGAAEKIAPELDPRRLRLWLGIILTLTAWLIPVSYTHLDVYKRQTSARCGASC